jgi:hypothetical protein
MDTNIKKKQGRIIARQKILCLYMTLGFPTSILKAKTGIASYPNDTDT